MVCIIPYLKRHHTLFVARKINLMIISDDSALKHLNIPEIRNKKEYCMPALLSLKITIKFAHNLKKNRKCNILRLCSVLLYLSSCQIMHE